MSRPTLGIAAPVVAVSLLLLGSMPAYAYLDPGTGSIMLQMILGGLAGLAVAVKLYWARIVEVFERIFKRGRAPEPTASHDEDVIEQKTEPAGNDNSA